MKFTLRLRQMRHINGRVSTSWLVLERDMPMEGVASPRCYAKKARMRILRESMRTVKRRRDRHDWMRR